MQVEVRKDESYDTILIYIPYIIWYKNIYKYSQQYLHNWALIQLNIIKIHKIKLNHQKNDPYSNQLQEWTYIFYPLSTSHIFLLICIYECTFCSFHVLSEVTRLRNRPIRPITRFSGRHYSGRDSLSTSGGFWNSTFLQNQSFQLSLGSITGSTKTIFFLIKNCSCTLSGALIVNKLSSSYS